MPIENTTDRMKDPVEQWGFLLGAMSDGGPGPSIERQERSGQQQLVHSDHLPSRCPREEMEALGFTFGEQNPRDGLFIPATLPEGWTREGSDHAMWSFLRDQHGRKRASIFYKAAFYDRDAFMYLVDLDGYVKETIREGQSFVFDAEWATPETVAAAIQRIRDGEHAEAAKFREVHMEEAAKRHDEMADKCAAVLNAMGA
jgi:hypothetical protein